MYAYKHPHMCMCMCVNGVYFLSVSGELLDRSKVSLKYYALEGCQGNLCKLLRHYST